MIRHLFRKHQREGYGAFSICRLCGVLEYFDRNHRFTYDFRGKNLTYTVLRELQPNNKEDV